MNNMFFPNTSCQVLVLVDVGTTPSNRRAIGLYFPNDVDAMYTVAEMLLARKIPDSNVRRQKVLFTQPSIPWTC